MSRSKIFAVLAVAVVVLAAGAADAKKKKGPKITHKVTFDFYFQPQRCFPNALRPVHVCAAAAPTETRHYMPSNAATRSPMTSTQARSTPPRY